MMTTILITLIVASWVAVAVVGAQAYLLGEEVGLVDNRSKSFEAIPVTDRPKNYAGRRWPNQ